MNNAFLAIESTRFDEAPNEESLRSKESNLVRIIEALEVLASTKEWSSLKTLIFDDLSSSLKKRRELEAAKDNPDPLKLTKLSGEIKWSERFADLQKLADSYRVELSNIKKQLYGTRNTG